jgi:hypothetical protein
MIALALAALLTPPASAMARKPRTAKDPTMQTDGQQSKLDTPGHRVVTTPEDWARLWKEIGREAPPADLTTQFAVAAFAGTRNTGGYRIVFDAPVERADTLLIRYAVVAPPKGGFVTMALTHPYAVKLFPKTAKKIQVEGRDQ